MRRQVNYYCTDACIFGTLKRVGVRLIPKDTDELTDRRYKQLKGIDNK